MKKISIIIALFTMCIATAFGQAKKPKLMVVPSDA